MRIHINVMGEDHSWVLADWDFKRKPFPLLIVLRLTEGGEIYDTRYLEFEITGNRIEGRNK